MNILIIAGGIPTKDNPLEGIFSYDQAVALKEYGHNVIYLTVDIRSIRRKRRMGFYTEERNGISCGCASVPVGNLPISIRNMIGDILVNILYNKFFDDFKADVIHAHFNEMGSISLKLSKRLKAPLVITEHSSELSSFRIKSSHLKSIKNAYCNAGTVVAVSEALSKDIKRHTGVESIVVNNMVDLDLFVKEHYFHEGKFNIVHVGNLVKIKNQTLLLEAFSLFHNNHPETHLYIVGDGELKDELVQKCVQLNLLESVSFLGRLERKEIAKLFCKCRLFAFTSITETFGVACVEALAAGLPVVTTDCGGPNEFINESNGVIVPKHNAEEYCKAMERIYVNIKNYDRGKISDGIQNRFSSQCIAEKLTTVYKGVIVDGSRLL